MKSMPSKVKKGEAKEQEPEAADRPTEESKEPTTLTISNDSIKKPITCHRYSPKIEKTDTSTLVFTHGAGGTLSAPAVVNFCIGYSKGASILAFQGSMNLKARAKGFHACISHLKPTNSGAQTLVLGGRSMGARAAVIAATEHLSSSSAPSPIVNLILVSYPLKGPKDDIRDQILLDLPSSTRVFFIIGDKDAMCPLDLLNKTRKKMAAKSQLAVVKGADHGMHVKGKDKEKKAGEESGMRALDWVKGKLDVEMVEIIAEEEEADE
jgi:predicted alpha/beta-hydrolase family hydrolase